ncbi:type VII secretion target [Nocardia sp. NPDC060259]|uniref:type VII secretion target n=1 Tax=Nocardia sp. NPDC060259 TaxID=3347088 RepID=UPI00365BE6EF
MKITPESLKDSAREILGIADEFENPAKVPPLGTDDLVKAMKFSPLPDAVKDADASSRTAQSTLRKRYIWMSHLLYTTARTFHDTDVELADNLNSMGSINVFGPMSGE